MCALEPFPYSLLDGASERAGAYWCRHQHRQCPHRQCQHRQCQHQYRSAQGHSYTASPVHCAIWPRCLKVSLKYLTARSLVSGPREKGLRSPG